MAKKSSRIKVGLKCEETGHVMYVTNKNKVNTTEPLRLRKYNKILRKHVWYKETKDID